MKSPPAIQSQIPPNPDRVVGLDIHPDTFAAAILEGRDPLKARVSQSVTRAPLPSLERWIGRNTRADDILVLEASANFFSIVERLEAIKRKALILESHRAGQVGKSLSGQ
ncbi:MAG TPA: hypothetical protein VIT91_03415 [Chthoniobacterales bacterium]